MRLDNTTVGRNIAKLRRLRDIKASDMASRLGLSEAAYTKYERGETAINIDFVQRIADTLEISPLAIISATEGNFLNAISNSSIAIQENSTFQTSNEKHTELLQTLLAHCVKTNDRLLALLERDVTGDR